MNFEKLTATIEQTHQHFQQQAVKAVNVSLTIRNWLIGFYIVEFEQKGEDRAAYGTRLVDSLAESINIKGLGNRNLKLFRQFYFAYTELGGAINQIIDLPEKAIYQIVQSPTAQLQKTEIKKHSEGKTLVATKTAPSERYFCSSESCEGKEPCRGDIF